MVQITNVDVTQGIAELAVNLRSEPAIMLVKFLQMVPVEVTVVISAKDLTMEIAVVQTIDVDAMLDIVEPAVNLLLELAVQRLLLLRLRQSELPVPL